MKIAREGKEFELTPEELLAAFLEQEQIYSLENIRHNTSLYMSVNDCDRFRDDAHFIENAAKKLRENEARGLSYDDALSSAFKESKQEFFDENKANLQADELFDFLDELLKDAAAIEYKGIIFDDWAVDPEYNTVWAEICEGCANKHMDVIAADLDDAGAVGICSVLGCDVSGAETTNEHHYYIDFKPALIRPLTQEQLIELQAATPEKSSALSGQKHPVPQAHTEKDVTPADYSTYSTEDLMEMEKSAYAEYYKLATNPRNQ